MPFKVSVTKSPTSSMNRWIDAHQEAAKVSCNDPTFADPVNSDPGDQWDKSGAQGLWLAIVWHWQSTTHGNYKSLTEFVAETLGVGEGSASFDCGDLGDMNGCTGYGPSDPKCVRLHLSYPRWPESLRRVESTSGAGRNADPRQPLQHK